MNKNYHIITFGCQMNYSDSDRLRGFLNKQGFKENFNLNKVSLIIINTCGIRQSAEDRVYSLVHKIRKSNKLVKIVITGCLSQRQDVKNRLASQVDLFMPINAIPDILKLISGRLLKSKLSLDEVRLMQGEKYLTILPQYQSNFSAFVPIGNGCNNFCSFCVVPYARGREVYRPAQDIIKEVKKLLESGYKEITLIAQNVNSYKSKFYDFPKLLEKIAKMKGDFWLRFSSSHPKDVSSALIKVIGSYKKICPHLHLALQSGDDKILQAMNRRYSVKHFLDLISKVRKARPGIAITTDVIVGFPGETKENFKNTVKVFRQVKFDLAYISRYSPRPQTAAYFLKDNVSSMEKKQRKKELEAVLSKTAYSNNICYKNRAVKILIEGINKNNNYYGKTGSYKLVIIRGNYKPKLEVIGSFVAVKINRIRDFGLEGELL
jgi:tRNA-2-methylthio-N6-dimethylallyladenosine synthase